MTYDYAKQAERCCRYELGLTTSSFVTFGARDSQRKGLLSGERLSLQLKQMEHAYLSAHRREFEVTKHYSLVRNDPHALISLKAQGHCEIELPETLFDSDYPGHFLRRVKTVSLTIPAVAGPYTSVNCTLTLLRDKTRVKSTPADSYPEREGEEDDRFVTNWARTQAIATSSGQNDHGMFDLNFRDDRYLPFEGAGIAGSRWRLEIDPGTNAFDLKQLPDVVLHILYTARDGGAPLKAAARKALQDAIGAEASRPQARMFSLKHEFPTEWYQLTRTGAPASCSLALVKERFPFIFKGMTLTTGKVSLYAFLKSGDGPAAPISLGLTPPSGTELPVDLAGNPKWQRVLELKKAPITNEVVATDAAGATWVVTTKSAEFAKHVDELLLVCEYAVTEGR